MGWGDAGTAVTALGQAAVATLAFRVGGELRVAAVVKASFVLAQDGPMILTDPEPIRRADEHRGEGAASSLVTPGDLVPYRPRVNVLLAGHARAPLDRPTPAMGVRLMIARGSSLVLDKRLVVRGMPDPSGRTREPSPFSAMQFAWELSAATPDNPAGIHETHGAWPHILDPRHRERAAGFGPISPRWPARRRLFPAADAALAARIPELPEGFAWTYFDVAPEDQCLDAIHGDEWVGFEGMSSQIPRVQSCLPGVRARAGVYGAAPQLRAGRPLALTADTLSIDADRLRCSVVWRGSFTVAHEQDLGTLQVFAGVETADAPLSFPISAPALAPPRPGPSVTVELKASALDATLGAVAVISPVAALPFAPSAPRPATPRPPPPEPSEEPVTTELAPAGPGLTGTMGAVAVQSPFAALPFVSPVAPPAATPARRPAPPLASSTVELKLPVPGLDSTMGIGEVISPFAALPFTPSAAPPPRPAAPRRLPPATPFERGRIAPAPRPIGDATIDVASPLPRAQPEERPPTSPSSPRAPLPLTVGQEAVQAEPSRGAPAPVPPVQAEPPRTLGEFFLAAMARADSAGGPDPRWGGSAETPV